MAYTVSEAYKRVLDEADKMGSDYMPLPEMLSLFKKETLGFVRERAKDIEKNQEITTDLVPLIKPLSIPLIPGAQRKYCRHRFGRRIRNQNGYWSDPCPPHRQRAR